MRLNSIEQIPDRRSQTGLYEIKSLKGDHPARAMVGSLMEPCEEESWKFILLLVEDTVADGLGLNFGRPHGMSDRGMASAVGPAPEYIEMVPQWVKSNAGLPVIANLTPNISDIRKWTEVGARMPISGFGGVIT